MERMTGQYELAMMKAGSLSESLREEVFVWHGVSGNRLCLWVTLDSAPPVAGAELYATVDQGLAEVQTSRVYIHI